MIAVYLLLLSGGFGYSPGFGAGAFAEHKYIGGTIQYARRDKNEIRDSYRLAASLYGRSRGSLFGVAGILLSSTHTEHWVKDAWAPFVGVGAESDRWRSEWRYMLKDSTVNELHGPSIIIQYSPRRLFLRFKGSYLSFDGGRRDGSASISIGLRR